MSNPIKTREDEVERLFKANERVRCYLSGWGTDGWFNFSEQEKAACDRVKALRKEIHLLRKHAGLRHKTSSVAHGGRRTA